MLRNNLECKSSVLCIAWAWAEISSITINTACSHGGTAQRGIYLQIHLSNTADVTDCRRMTNACCLMATLQDMCTMARRKKNGGLAKTGSNKQLNGWTDGQLVMLNTFHIPLCVISQCLSFPAAIYLLRSRENQIISHPPTPKKRLFENTMQRRKLNSIKYFLVPRFKMNGGKFTPWASIHSFHQQTCLQRQRQCLGVLLKRAKTREWMFTYVAVYVPAVLWSGGHVNATMDNKAFVCLFFSPI